MRLLANTAILYALGAFLAPTPFTHAASSSTKLRGHDDTIKASSAGTTPTERRRLKKPLDDTTDCVTTTLVEVEHSDPSLEESFLSCESSDGNQSYKVKGISQDFINKNKKSVADGTSTLDLPLGTVVNLDDGSIELPKNASPKLKENNGNGNGKKKGLFKDDDSRQRKLVSGDRWVLVVRVQHATDASTSATVGRLSDSVFGNNADGNGADPVTLKSQYDACSYGQLNFIEAIDRNGNTGVNIRNGNGTFSLFIIICCVKFVYMLHLLESFTISFF